MTLNEKAKELGERLARSTAPKELKDAILELLPKLTERDLDYLLYSLRFEEGEHARLEAALNAFQQDLKARWEALKTDEQRIVDEAIEDFLDDTASLGATKKAGAAAG
jgi:hypothetical protein